MGRFRSNQGIFRPTRGGRRRQPTRHDELKEWARQKIKAALDVAIDGSESPRLSLRHDATVMAKITFSNNTVSAEEAPPGVTTVPLAELPQLAALAKKSRSGLVDGKVVSGARAITFRDAIFEAVAAHAARDNRLAVG